MNPPCCHYCGDPNPTMRLRFEVLSDGLGRIGGSTAHLPVSVNRDASDRCGSPKAIAERRTERQGAFSRALLADKVHPSTAEREAWVRHGTVPAGFIARP